MLKQILSKLPKKLPKLDSKDSAENDSGNNSSSFGDAFQCTNVGTALSSKLNIVKRVSSAVFPASIMSGMEEVEPNLSFKDVPNVQKQNLFVSKLNNCCEALDFDDTHKIDVRRQVLMDLVEFVESGSAKFNEAAILAVCRVCSINLFRDFPPKLHSNSSGRETEFEESIFDPAWFHLQVLYDLLLRFVSSASLDAKAAKKHLDHLFILRLLDLFDSSDPREREYLKTILHRIYGKFMVHRSFIRKAINNIMYRFVLETEQHNGISELLEILGSIITGFALPLKEEHKLLLLRVLIPLHKPKSIGIYHQQLTYCVVQFVYKDSNLASMVMKGLLKNWPITNSQKELMFLSEVEEILEMTTMAEFQKIVVPLFCRIRCCLSSFHYQVAERALLLWNNEHVIDLIERNKHVIFPLVFSSLETNAQNHWNKAVLNLTLNVQKMFLEMDEELMFACQLNLKEEESRSSLADEKRRLTWERLENEGLFNVAPATCSVAG